MSQQDLIRKRERYNTDPDYKKNQIEKSIKRFKLKKDQVYQTQKLHFELNRIKINEKRKERYWKDQDRRQKKLEYLKERRERLKNKGYTKDELSHVEHFLKTVDAEIRDIVYTRAYRTYQRINRNGIPTIGFR